jgi:phosphate starvation-inducible membrane PsiE
MKIMNTVAAQTAVPAARREGFRSFVGICLAVASLKLAIQIAGNVLAQHAGYGIFRDEMYYLICGRHLAFGYVDQPPMVALQARLTDILFGYDHMWSLRLFSALAGAVKVFLTGAIVWAMGGGRRAAALAMLGVTVAGVYLGIDSFLSMNSFEPVFWMTCALALIRIVQADGEPDPGRVVRNWWIILGISAGLGLENKDNEVFFLVAVLIALLLTPQRRILASRWFAVALGLIVALALPNLLWQIHYHFPTLEWLVDVSRSNKDVKLPPLQFVLGQVMMLTPWTVALWLSGVVWLLVSKRTRPFRFLGVLYIVFLAMMMALHAKDYYLAPIYPIYFAAGAMRWLPVSKSSMTRNVLVSAYVLLLLVGFVLTVPFSIPVLPPQRLVAWMETMHFEPKDSENHAETILPQFYADRFGWHEMVEKVARVYNALPPQERTITGIYADNYGEASAINLFGPKYGLPVAISGHQSYWLWGPNGYTGHEAIMITDASPARLKRYFASCSEEAVLNNPLSMPWEKKPIYLCRGGIHSFAADWKDLKNYY